MPSIDPKKITAAFMRGRLFAIDGGVRDNRESADWLAGYDFEACPPKACGGENWEPVDVDQWIMVDSVVQEIPIPQFDGSIHIHTVTQPRFRKERR